MIKIPKGTLIYRAARQCESVPTPRYCEDTGKTGVYFSVVSPYLSEQLRFEKGYDVVLSTYVLTDDVIVYKDKYCLRELAAMSPSHFDCPIYPIGNDFQTDVAKRGAELFLNARDLRYVKLVDHRPLPLHGNRRRRQYDRSALDEYVSRHRH
jgi:hypothetical protein